MARTRRLLFVTVPMHGHINPLLEPASQLVKQGQCVLFVTYEQHRSAVEAAGIPFKSLGPDCIDRKQQSQIDPYATKKAKMLASAALFTGTGGMGVPAVQAKVRSADECGTCVQLQFCSVHAHQRLARS